ncbi:MAG: NAD(P)/FAD-dependent oxidoreductase [Steroidobacteraceae bacterium]|jgi:monoamine oxidase
MRAEYDVLIVGAGAAGLAAGRALAAAGLRTAILEARERVGGRILTEHVACAAGPIPVELGAEFIHGLPKSSWDIVGEAGLAAYELAGSDLVYANGRLGAPGREHGSTHRVLEDMIEWLAQQSPGFDMSFAGYLRARAIEESIGEPAARFVEGFNAADRHRIGIAALATQQRAEDLIDTDRLFRLRGGYHALPQFLADQFVRSGGELVLAAPVHRVAWGRGSVALSVGAGGASRELHASRALITAPLGVLQAGAIEFAPLPGEILEQAARLAMGEAARIVLIFRDRFWREPPACADALSFLFAPSELPATWWTPMPDRAPVITGWAGGPKAAALRRAATRSAALAQCLTTLSKVFGLPRPELDALLVSWHYHDWFADAYARGAYSYVPAGALDAPERMTHPIEDTLYFAGEHTDVTGHWGTVHAALAAGSRAAAAILASPRA